MRRDVLDFERFSALFFYFYAVRQFQKSSKMPEKPCCDLKTERLWLVRRSLGEGGWLFSTPCHGIAVWRRRIKLPFSSHQQSFFSQILPDF